ncbi:MAG TPA: alpha-L-fucosidase [bacterium]|nr:alpha-L-fucosidase [bacterium]HQO34305.1 alpha-L-fucosidase [bacterium]HQP99862.1 alpha-L-fucosidase [bacterium]
MRRPIARFHSMCETYLWLALSVAISFCRFTPLVQGQSLERLQKVFLDLKFGMFIHFNMATFHNIEHALGTEDPATFNLTQLDIPQWAEASRLAGMKYAVLTVRHVDGFCLWPTKTTDHNVANSPCKKDIVREFVDVFRNHGLKVGFYYSIQDRHNGPSLEIAVNQLTELLTGYGDILILWFDAWGKGYTAYEDYPFDTIVSHVRLLQPDCLILSNDNGKSPGPTDIRCYEHDEGRPPQDGIPSEVCYKLQSAWFWKEIDPEREVLAVDRVIDELLIPLNANHTNFLLNCAPNRQGRLDENVVQRLAEIGKRLAAVSGAVDEEEVEREKK